MEVNLSKFSLFFIIFFILGVGFASFLPIPFFIYFPLVVLVLILLYFKRNFKKEWIILGGIFLFGIFWYQLSFPEDNSQYINFYNNQSISFQGRVVKEVEKRIKKEKLFIGDIKINQKNIKGKILVDVKNYSDYKYGDILKIKGYIRKPTNFSDFNYKMYLARFGVYSVCYYPEIEKIAESQSFFYKNILKIRQKSKRIINRFLPEPQSSILNALILGYKKGMPDSLRNSFARAGVSHVLAISGLHIAILISILMVLFLKVFKLDSKLSLILTLVFISFFVVLVGAPASAVRAAIMGLVLLLSQKLGRPHGSLRILLLAAFLMLFVNPKLLGWDIGFQFSFLAVLGIYFLTPLFKKALKRIPDFQFLPVRSYLSVSLGAQLMVLPLVLFYFGNLSLIAPISNILILFIIPLVMIFGFLLLITSLIFMSLGSIFVWPVFLFLTYILLVVKIVSDIPLLSFIFSSFPLLGVVGFYIVIIFIIFKNLNNLNEK